jgi:hypothetical protein
MSACVTKEHCRPCALSVSFSPDERLSPRNLGFAATHASALAGTSARTVWLDGRPDRHTVTYPSKPPASGVDCHALAALRFPTVQRAGEVVSPAFLPPPTSPQVVGVRLDPPYNTGNEGRIDNYRYVDWQGGGVRHRRDRRGRPVRQRVEHPRRRDPLRHGGEPRRRARNRNHPRLGLRGTVPGDRTRALPRCSAVSSGCQQLGGLVGRDGRCRRVTSSWHGGGCTGEADLTNAFCGSCSVQVDTVLNLPALHRRRRQLPTATPVPGHGAAWTRCSRSARRRPPPCPLREPTVATAS